MRKGDASRPVFFRAVYIYVTRAKDGNKFAKKVEIYDFRDWIVSS